MEQAIESSVEHSENISHLNMAPQAIRELLDKIVKTVGTPDGPVIALTTSGARFFLRQITENSVQNLFILSHNEVPSGVKVLSLGLVH